MKNIVEIKNIRGYVDDSGTAFINLEDAARGLGITRSKWNVTTKQATSIIRWDRIKQYCTEIGYPQVGTRFQYNFISSIISIHSGNSTLFINLTFF